MKKFSLGALVAAGLLMGGLGAGSASAADLGGNCCADLEERIAELEATTARKGNRKVSLTISGWVGEQVYWWDDGLEQNVYLAGLGATLDTHFKFSGQATISPGWYAGYVIHIEVNTADPLLGQNQFADDANHTIGGNSLYALQSFWFVKSDHLGKVSVGRQSQASDNTAILVDGSGSLVPANWVVFEGAGFFIHGQNIAPNAVIWNDLINCLHGGVGGDCDGATRKVVRYDSPTFSGFSVSASWGEDDMWDVAARYAGEHGGFKVAAAVAYNEWSDNVTNFALATVSNPELKYFQAGLYVEHVATGIFGYGAYGHLEYGAALDFGGIQHPDGETWYVKGGLRERWNHLGHTVVYGEYENIQDQWTPGLTGGVTGSEFRLFGGGIVQEIDAAAMSIWLSYRHFEGDFDRTPGLPLATVDDFDLVKFGALINF